MGRGISLALLGLLAVLTASGRASPARPLGACSSSDTMVTIADFSFTPSSVTINAGDTVCWTNAGTFDHTATSNDATTFDSG
jgi:plastocyanin